MCSLWLFFSCLALLNSTELLYSSMVFFNFPWLFAKLFSCVFVHIQYVCSPVLRVSICWDYPKYLDKTVFFEMNNNSFRRYLNRIRRLFFVLSGFTKRFDFNLVKKCHCFFLIALRFFMLAYHISNITYLGLNPRFSALSIISRKWSFLVLLSSSML